MRVEAAKSVWKRNYNKYCFFLTDDSPSVGRQRSNPKAIYTPGSCLLLQVSLNFLKKTVTCPRRSLFFRAAYQPLVAT